MAVGVGSDPLKLPLLLTASLARCSSSSQYFLPPLLLLSDVCLCPAATGATATAAAAATTRAAAAIPVLASSARRSRRALRPTSCSFLSRHPDVSQQFGISGSFADGSLPGFPARSGSFWPPLERSSARNPRPVASALASSPASSFPSNGPSYRYRYSLTSFSFRILHSLPRARGGPRSLLPFRRSH